MDSWPAAKAFIVDDGKVLVVKRSNYTLQKPGIWELPGGRLEKGEGVFKGLKREVLEETGLEIEIKERLSMRSFTRIEGQKIRLAIFVCTLKTKQVKLSSEHSNFQWLEIKKAKGTIAEFYNQEIEEYKKRFLD